MKITLEQLVDALVDGGLIYFDTYEKHHEVAVREGCSVEDYIDAVLDRLNKLPNAPEGNQQ